MHTDAHKKESEEKTMKKERMTKSNPLFTPSLIPHGNGKLLDYDDKESCIAYRYAQFNTRAIDDCPFRSAGCEKVCYATKGNHQFPSVRDSRSRSYEESKRDDFPLRMEYTIRYHLNTKRFKGTVMIIRIHESGDFYSLQYLRKWIEIWKNLADESVLFVFYTKSFPLFLMLTEEEKDIIRNMMKAGKLSMNLSIDDTTSEKQMIAYLQMIAEYPLSNTYRVTEKVSATDDKCDCSDCARCGACNKARGKEKVVEIHSASNAEKEEYRKNKRSGK